MRYEIATNAGIVWQTIDTNNGQVTYKELLKATGLTETQALLALGWLVREDKVTLQKDGEAIDAVTLYQERYY